MKEDKVFDDDGMPIERVRLHITKKPYRQALPDFHSNVVFYIEDYLKLGLENGRQSGDQGWVGDIVDGSSQLGADGKATIFFQGISRVCTRCR